MMDASPVNEPDMELRQTRDATTRETERASDRCNRLMWPDGGGFAFKASRYLRYGFVGFLALSILMAVNRLATSNSQLAGQLAFAAIGCAAALALYQWQVRRIQASVVQKAPQTSIRYVAKADGLHWSDQGIQGFIAWDAIDKLANDSHDLVAVVRTGHQFSLIKGAFDGQDVEGFCTEFVRRWQESRSQA